MKIDHVGYAVKKMDKAIKEFEILGYRFEKIINDYDRNLYVCFGNNGSYRVELVSPIDKERPSPVDTYLSKVGPTAYHICYKSSDLEGDISELEKQGFRVIIPTTFATAFSNEHDRRVVFLIGKNFGIFEIVEE